MKKYYIILFLFFANINFLLSRNIFLDFIYKILQLNNMDYYSRDNFDSIIINTKFIDFVDSVSIYGYKTVNYIPGKYLCIINYMETDLATFSIEEFKQISFKSKKIYSFFNYFLNKRLYLMSIKFIVCLSDKK